LQAVEKSVPESPCSIALGDGNGLDVISALKDSRPEARIIVLLGYGTIAGCGDLAHLSRARAFY
jgi:two-component system response regulator RegA